MWIGRIIGGIFGWIMGGPILGILGFFVGRLFDQGLIQQRIFQEPFSSYHHSSESYSDGRRRLPLVFLNISFQVMGHIAKIDGRVTEKSIAFAKSIMDELNLSHTQRTMAIDSFNLGKGAQFNLERALEALFYSGMPERTYWLKVFMDIQLRAIATNKPQSRQKQSVIATIHRYCQSAMYTSSPDWTEFYRKYTQQQSSRDRTRINHPTQAHNLLDDYELLSIKPEASQLEVKQAYRRLMNQHHPDKLIAKKASNESIKLATEKTQQIKAAYERICKANSIH